MRFPTATLRRRAGGPAALALIMLTATACGGAGADQAPTATVDLAVAERAAYEETIARLEGEVRQARDEAAALELASEGQRIVGDPEAAERCRAELVGVRDELARYKAGLQRAVDQINNQRPQLIAVPVPSGRPAAPAPRAPGRVVSRIGPNLQQLAHALVVSGEIWSYRDEPVDVTLTFELFENERAVREESIEIKVAPNANAAYRHTFQRSATGGNNYTVRLSSIDPR